MVDARAEHVGSLLRPQALLRTRDARAAGDRSDPGLKAAEDAAVREAVAMQEDADLPVVNDGELRRESFQSELAASVDGFNGVGIDAWLWGSWHSDALGDKEVGGPEQVAVTEVVVLGLVTTKSARLEDPAELER